MDGIALGFASFSSHRTNSWNYVFFFFLLMIQNYVRGLNCWVFPYQVVNLPVILSIYIKTEIPVRLPK